jgi:hypothetical protein
MDIKTCNFSILCNEVKLFLLLNIEINNMHKFNILTFNLWIFFKKTKIIHHYCAFAIKHDNTKSKQHKITHNPLESPLLIIISH